MKYLDEIPIDELKEIKLSPFKASVKAESDVHWNGEKKEQLVMPNQGPQQKWMTDYMAETWVEIHFKEATYTVLGVGFVSADNCPYRDP